MLAHEYTPYMKRNGGATSIRFEVTRLKTLGTPCKIEHNNRVGRKYTHDFYQYSRLKRASSGYSVVSRSGVNHLFKAKCQYIYIYGTVMFCALCVKRTSAKEIKSSRITEAGHVCMYKHIHITRYITNRDVPDWHV